MAYRRRQDNDGKYLRLTGLWANKKKDNLWTGKMKAEDVVKLIEKADEADKAGAELVFFLWANDQKKRNDPEFTIQVSVSEEEVGGGRGRLYGRSSGRGREDREDREDSRDNDRDNDREEKEPEPEEKPRGRGRKAEPEPAPRGKKDKRDDW
jgi:hypothetical protein